MSRDAKAGDERARRFREAVFPHLDDAYTLARFLLRNQQDAEDAVQECILRALRHFDTFRGPAIKPWLLTILRHICYAEHARRARRETPLDLADCENVTEKLLWQDPQAAADSLIINRQEDIAIRQSVEALPTPFREAVVLREFNGLSYREIADVTGVPVGTVMSRLARGRAILLAAWKAMNGAAPRHPTTRQMECTPR